MKKIKLILVVIIFVITTLLGGCQKEELASSQQMVVSIDGQSVNLDEVMYHIMIAEFQGKLIASYFGNEDKYWSSEYEQGITMSQAIKEKVMEDVIKYEIFYRQALEKGMNLSEEEKSAVKEEAMSIKYNITEEALELAQLNEEDLISIGEKIALSTKAYQAFIKSLGADEESIRSSIDTNDYIEYKIQYMFIPTMKQVANELIPLGDKEKQIAYEKIQGYEALAVESNDFKSIEIKAEDSIKVGEVRFSETDNEFSEESQIVDVTKQLEINEVSDIFETSRGYYIIKRLADTSELRYDEAVSSEIQKKEEEVILPAYEKLKKNYKIKINQKVWKKIEIGKMTIH